jgi:hypothetical protein
VIVYLWRLGFLFRLTQDGTFNSVAFAHALKTLTGLAGSEGSVAYASFVRAGY